MGLSQHQPKPKPAQWSVRFAPGHGHHVISPGGDVHATLDCRDKAETIRDAFQAKDAAAAKRIERPCMCCSTTFLSEGIHNRMCPRCRPRTDGWDPHGVAPKEGRRR